MSALGRGERGPDGSGGRAGVIARAATAAWLALAPSAYAVAMRPAGTRMTPYLALHALLALASLVAWRALEIAGPAARRGAALAVAAGVAGRALLLFAPPFSTTDVGRYLWDGAVLASGADPWALAPEAPALAALATRFPPPLDHADVATCYPPLALALFAACALAGPALALSAWKLVVTSASIATLLVVWRQVRGGARPHDAVLLALSPLALLEAGVGAHLDVLVALALVASVALLSRGREADAALALGVAAALKLLPALLVVAVLPHARRRLRFVLLAAAPGASSFGLALGAGLVPFGSLGLVARHWSFGSPLFATLVGAWPDHEAWVRVALAALAVLGVAAVALGRRPAARAGRSGARTPGATRSAAAAVHDALGVMLLSSPTLYPWYALPLGALAPLSPAAWSVALATALPLSYEVVDAYQGAGVWAPAAWPLAVTALALVLGLGLDLARRARNTSPEEASCARIALAAPRSQPSSSSSASRR